MRKFNKATAAVVAGAVVTIVGTFVTIDAEVMASIQTLLTAVLVWLVPNTEE